MMMQESAGVSSISARDHQLIGQYCKEQQQQQQQQQVQQHQQRSNMNPNGEHEQALKCPRCDSPNTKFCYYNNYNLTQPRHFCKTCRRYWTKGGALRNVPIGGGCRKNKRSKQRPKDHNPLAPVDQDSSPTALNVSNSLSLLQNLWPTPAASSGSSLLDLPSSDRFNLAFAKLQTHSRLLVGHHNITDGNINTSGGHGSSNGISIMSLLQQQQHQPSMKGDGIEDPSGGHMINLFQNPASHIASVIVPPSTTVDMGSGSLNIELESLSNSTSCVNGDWPWRLQQHRLGMVLGDQGQNSNNNVESGMVPDHLILPDVNDHRFIHLQHQYMKGKSAVTNDLVTQAFETRPVSEWQSVADSLLELTPTPTPTTAAGESSYWHDLQSM